MESSDLQGLSVTIAEAYQALREVNCVEDVYDVMEFVSDEVKNSYEHIVCKTGCSDCCKGLHPPYVTAAEWEYILYYISDLPKPIQDEIVRRANWYSQQYKDALLLQQDLISGQIQTQQEIDVAYKTLSKALSDATCPFLVIDRCGIYPVRPAKCRAHGQYLVQVGEKIRIQTCLPQVNEWEDYINSKSGDRSLTMPLWNVYEKVISLLNPPGTLVATMPIWLLTHIRGNKILKELNPKPEIVI
jgi:Fe-S-cluster containining protein